ncbi:aTP-dependent DNA helicase RecQ family [Prevotella sp. CAG:520]|nr:aTP-dependent DNA helicase RecQ family [Prevotella sp. CAG:520]
MGYDDTLYLKILRDTWGYSDFRGIQRDIIRSIAEGKDTLGLMPTGGGKSLTFQVPALAMEGVCIVITPLIALMKDQVDNLRRRQVLAAAIYLGMSRQEIVKTLENCVLGHTKILYVSPERIGSELFQTKLAHIKVSFITIDEAHCISQWGYDFRPSYLHIADIRRIKPDAPILALTATATTEVIDDIQEQLKFKEKNVFRMSFERKNLAYVVRSSDNKMQQLIHILNSISGSAIVYVRSRKLAKEISEYILNNNISATFYHAGLERSTKDERQKKWHDDEVRVMVATNAFGMGIDKPDVRVVIHISCPDSIEAYFQEAGRAGRDGKKAYAVLLYDRGDRTKLVKRIAQEFPDKKEICRVYEHVAYYLQIAAGSGYGRTFRFEIEKFCRIFHHYPVIVNSALKILTRAGYLEYDVDPDSRTRVKFTLERDQLYMLHDTTPNEEAVITTMLREYSGLFVDYHFVEIAFIAHASGLTQQQVYLILTSLSQRRILHFIPERSVPLLTYTRDRVLPEEIVISKTVYEERKAQFEKRIESIINYAENDTVCRSRQLLRYFGETRTEDCQQCDVCLAHQKTPQSYKNAFNQALKAIKEMLADGEKHSITELNKITLNQDAKDEALEYLVNEEVIGVKYNDIYLKK